jgi:hypothetical protein
MTFAAPLGGEKMNRAAAMEGSLMKRLLVFILVLSLLVLTGTLVSANV